MRSHLTNEELLLWLRDPEHHFVERKSYGDWKKDALKTAVAFANSAPIGSPAVLFIGVKDKGAIEPEQDIDTIQKTFSKEVAQAYPPIYYETRIVRDDQGLRCLAIVIPGSQDRPHFTGHSFVRVGSESREASEAQFQELIAQRNGKVRELLLWKDKGVTLRLLSRVRDGVKERAPLEAIVVACTPLYVTFQIHPSSLFSYSISALELSFDHNKQRLLIEVG